MLTGLLLIRHGEVPPSFRGRLRDWDGSFRLLWAAGQAACVQACGTGRTLEAGDGGKSRRLAIFHNYKSPEAGF